MLMCGHWHILEWPFLTGNQSVTNRKWKKISCENNLTLLSVSAWSRTLYIAPHWWHWLLRDIKAQEERWVCGGSLTPLPVCWHHCYSNCTLFNLAYSSKGVSTCECTKELSYECNCLVVCTVKEFVYRNSLFMWAWECILCGMHACKHVCMW